MKTNIFSLSLSELTMNYKNALLNLSKFKSYNYNQFGVYVGTPLNIVKRLEWHNFVLNEIKTTRITRRCRCYFQEEHLVCCLGLRESTFKNYDPNIKDTYLHQAIDRVILMNAIKNHSKIGLLGKPSE